MLSRKLHEQIFRNTPFPTPDRRDVRLSREHLENHGLDPSQGSVLPDTGFNIPDLQGKNIDEHFFHIGADTAQPWLDLAKTFSESPVTLNPEYWNIQPGWTKYHFHSDGSSYFE